MSGPEGPDLLTRLFNSPQHLNELKYNNIMTTILKLQNSLKDLRTNITDAICNECLDSDNPESKARWVELKDKYDRVEFTIGMLSCAIAYITSTKDDDDNAIEKCKLVMDDASKRARKILDTITV